MYTIPKSWYWKLQIRRGCWSTRHPKAAELGCSPMCPVLIKLSSVGRILSVLFFLACYKTWRSVASREELLDILILRPVWMCYDRVAYLERLNEGFCPESLKGVFLLPLIGRLLLIGWSHLDWWNESLMIDSCQSSAWSVHVSTWLRFWLRCSSKWTQTPIGEAERSSRIACAKKRLQARDERALHCWVWPGGLSWWSQRLSLCCSCCQIPQRHMLHSQRMGRKIVNWTGSRRAVVLLMWEGRPISATVRGQILVFLWVRQLCNFRDYWCSTLQFKKSVKSFRVLRT